jgi:adenylate cyclase
MFFAGRGIHGTGILNLDDKEKYSFGKHAEIFMDYNNAYEINDVTSDKFSSNFQENKNMKMSFGIVKHTIWFRLKLKNNTNKNWSILVDAPTVDYIEIFEKNQKGNFDNYRIGDTFKYNERKVDSISFFLPLQIKKGETKTIYLRTKSEGPLLIPTTVVSEKSVQTYIGDHSMYYGIYYGILFIVMLANLMIFFAIRNIDYFYYVLYLIATIFAQMFMDGISNKYLWGEHPEFSAIFGATSVMVMDVTIINFARHFLGLKVIARKMDYVLLFFFGLAIFSTIAGFFIPYGTAVKLAIVLTILMCIVVIIGSVISLLKGNKTAYYFIFAWTLLLAGMIARALTYNGTLEKNILTFYFMAIGSIIEVVLLSLALIDKINEMRKDKERAQRDLIASQKQSIEIQASMNRAFARFVPMQFLEFLEREKIEDIQLGDNVEKEMAVLFCDIRSFTELSEKMSPSENFKFLNTFYKKIGPVIRKNSGFIDKFIGDAIMALFPGNPEHAVQAAIGIQKMVNRINKVRIRMGYEPVSAGIGIHCGQLILGTIGEAERMEGTVISDTVNLASRIEGLTKRYGAKILVSQSVMDKIPDKEQYHYRVLNKVKVKGKQNFIRVVEIFDADDDGLKEQKKAYISLFEECIAFILKGDLKNAKIGMANLIQKIPDDKVAYNILKALEKTSAQEI